jgi:hypothetical protein
MLASFSLIATILAIWAYYEDTKTGGVLEATRLKREIVINYSV